MENYTTSGASKSLNKSIKDLEKISKNKLLDNAGELREKFRSRYKNILLKVALQWYKIGFKRGHKVSYLKFIKTGTVPKNLTKEMNASFIKGTFKRKVKLQSNIPKKTK
ncbi:MAG: hypothetical protein NTU73_15020 [Ignavibacteriae bacterium]|nr:hypothetical protein [Ignavibacteriota bacterium]